MYGGGLDRKFMRHFYCEPEIAVRWIYDCNSNPADRTFSRQAGGSEKILGKIFFTFSVTLAVTVDATTLSYHAVLLSVLPLLLATQYTSKKVIIYTYLISILGIFIGVMGSYYWGLCDANMLFLTVEPVSYYKEAATEGILRFELADYNPWYILPLYYVLPRSLLYSVCSRSLRAYPEISWIMSVMQEI